MLPALLMAQGPAGGLRRFIVDEGHLSQRRTGQHLGQEPLLLLPGRVRLDLDGRLLLLELHLFPHFVQVFADLRLAGVFQCRIAIDLQIAQHRVAHRGLELPAAAGKIGLLKIMVDRGEVAPLVLIPFLLRLLAQYLLQSQVAALLAELQEVDFAVFIEGEELVIDLRLFGVAALGQDADHLPGDADRAEKLQHAHPLVALFHIEAVHILIGLDRLTDAIGHVGAAERFPLGGKLRPRGQDRHEVRRKGIDPAPGLGADDALHGDLHDSQLRPLGRALRRHKVVQHRQAGRTARRHAGAIVPLAQL